MIYLPETLYRSKQFGISYPVRNTRQILDEEIPINQNGNKLNVLFVCSRNQWRSPTAEKVWGNRPNLNVRSSGTSPRARRVVGPKDIQWSDVIIVMEKKHKNRIVAEFARMVSHKPIYVLDIHDDYKYMDEELVDLLNTEVANVLGLS